MWADTLAVRCGPWLVGIRIDTATAASAMRRRYADRVVQDAAAVDSNYTVIAPHLLKGHGTLYRAGEVIAESRRMGTLLSLLDAELATLSVPDGCLRVIAIVHDVATGVVLEPASRPPGSPPGASPAAPIWVDPVHRTVQRADGTAFPLRGVVMVADELVPAVLAAMPTPADADAAEQWLDLLTHLSIGGRLRACSAAHVAATLTDLGRG